MSDPSGHPYQYVVLRCVPRVDREEFVNVGVVLYAEESRFLAAAWHVDPDRLRSLDPRIRVELDDHRQRHSRKAKQSGGSPRYDRSRR